MWFSASANKVGLKDFLGLSPEQMYVLRYGQWAELDSVVTISRDIDPAALLKIPVVEDILLLLNSMKDGELKATPRGFFPKKIALAIYHQQQAREWDKLFGLASEEYCPCVMAVRIAATQCGWMKLVRQRFSLTKAGKKLVEEGFKGDHFNKLLETWLRNFNWAYLDGYPDCNFVRNEALFMLYAIIKSGQTQQSSMCLAQVLLKAFPMIEEEVPSDRLRPDSFTSTLIKFVDMIVSLRFTERFCEYFGFVKIERVRKFAEEKESCRFETTEFLKRVFTWNVSEEQIKNSVEGMPKVSQEEIDFIFDAANDLENSSPALEAPGSHPLPSGWMLRPPTKH